MSIKSKIIHTLSVGHHYESLLKFRNQFVEPEPKKKRKIGNRNGDRITDCDKGKDYRYSPTPPSPGVSLVGDQLNAALPIIQSFYWDQNSADTLFNLYMYVIKKFKNYVFRHNLTKNGISPSFLSLSIASFSVSPRRLKFSSLSSLCILTAPSSADRWTDEFPW